MIRATTCIYEPQNSVCPKLQIKHCSSYNITDNTEKLQMKNKIYTTKQDTNLQPDTSLLKRLTDQEFSLEFYIIDGGCLLEKAITKSIMWQKEKGWLMHCPLELQGVPAYAPIHQASHSMMQACSSLQPLNEAKHKQIGMSRIKGMFAKDYSGRYNSIHFKSRFREPLTISLI